MFKIFKTVIFRFSSVESSLRTAIEKSLHPTQLQITNESHRHSRGEDTHFNMLIVSDKFKGLTKVQQHKLVYSALGDSMKQIHALTITCYAENP